MRKSIVTATAALLVAGMAFLACGGKSEDELTRELVREQLRQQGNAHALMNCTRTEVHLRGRQGLEVTGEDHMKIRQECRARLAR